MIKFGGTLQTAKRQASIPGSGSKAPSERALRLAIVLSLRFSLALCQLARRTRRTRRESFKQTNSFFRHVRPLREASCVRYRGL